MSALTTGNRCDPLAVRRDDLYETPSVAVEALLRVERLPRSIWEPSCGPGAIARVLRAHGHRVIATDLVDYASPDQDAARRDFLMEQSAPCRCIVTNPPFKLAGEFVEHALRLVPKVAMLLRLGFLESTGRAHILDCGRLARVYPFSNRVPMMHRHGHDQQKLQSSALAFAWFIWNRAHKGPAAIHRIQWRAQPLHVQSLQLLHGNIHCAQCGAAFVPSRSDARFCSGRCRVAAHRARRAA